ncbi:MAG TPA: hypothetical protein VER96_09725 [Polyangiaceae bacterium]|nr:hypothetical protein [Polyangiaceae bacterium]
MTPGLNALALGITLLGVPSAAASEVGLEVDPCLGLPEAEVRRLTELELATHVVPTSPSARLAVTVRVTCLDDQALIRVSDAGTTEALERTLDFTSPEVDVRARALALATAELLLAHWTELTGEPQKREPSAGPETATKAPAESPKTTPPFAASSKQEPRSSAHWDYLLGFAQASSTFDLADVGWGGGLRLGWVSGLSWLAADFELSAARGKRETELGHVHTTTWSVAARPTLRLVDRPLFVGVGVGARFGFAHVEGTPSDPEQVRGRVVSGTWGGPLAHGELGFGVNHFFGCAGVEAGYALKTVKGSVDGQVAAGVSRVFGSASLGFGWSF